MGIVYEAEQLEPVRRRVALKVMKIGLDTKAFVGRFQAERQALAMLEHPNIARVYDAGVTAEGRPFYTMEYVPGVSLTEFCDSQRLATRARIELMVRVCEGVQHAHDNGIIHRDLKPTNILVALHNDQPVPKIIDFGIAKALSGRLTDFTFATQLHQPVGTAAYMSPEQWEAGPLDLDIRTDVYSLGVILAQPGRCRRSLLRRAQPLHRQDQRPQLCAVAGNYGRDVRGNGQRLDRRGDPPGPARLPLCRHHRWEDGAGRRG